MLPLRLCVPRDATLKEHIKEALPGAAEAYYRFLGFVEARRLGRRAPKQIFTDIFATNKWSDPHSVSGQGSSLEHTRRVREVLPKLVREFGVETFLDVPCGDFHWMKEVNLDVRTYIGGDIVDQIIERNKKEHASDSPRREFRTLDLLVDPLPKSDVVFCRDCLVHLSNEHVRRAIANIKASGSKYLLTTTFSDRETNPSIATGQWRALNLRKAPFFFPEPLKLFNEHCEEWDGAYADKCLGLWEIAKIPG